MIGIRTWRAVAWTASALVAAGGIGGMSLASCAQTPVNVPVQTMGQPQSLDVVCMRVLDSSGNPIPAQPVPQASCAPLPPNTNASSLPYHLFALVTQTTRGELAVVDLTAGAVVDVDPNTPGINFLPIGRLPTDVAVTPDGKMAFVGSADPNAPALYALPSAIILGDSQGLDGGTTDIIPNLTTWPVCALPQAPGAISILPTSLYPSASDAGESLDLGYVIVAVLPGDGTKEHTAKVVTLRPEPFFRGAASFVDVGALPPGPSVGPGSLVPCPVLHYVELATPPPASAPLAPGPTWDDGVKYVDGGVDADLPSSSVACVATDAGGGIRTPEGSPVGGAAALDTSGPRPILYVADTRLPVIHVIDLSDPANPQELSPLLATSRVSPARIVSLGPIAVSPTTRDYKRFLYAVDRKEGSILVYDVTDPVSGPRAPLSRPHPELDPFQAPDRIAFGAPVAAVSFVRHDWPLTSKTAAGSAVPVLTAETGLLCNPNPNANPAGALPPLDQGPFVPNGDGAYYRANAIATQALLLGPGRLRGIFAFATLSTGSVVTIDVDDWDAPCRRPDPLAAHGLLNPTTGQPFLQTPGTDALLAGPFSAIAPPQPLAALGDIDPYHVPFAFPPTGNTTSAIYSASPVSLEWFFPVSAPHHARSQYLLRNDQTNGNHAPYLVTVPQLVAKGAPVATNGAQGIAEPNLVPTDTSFVDPSLQANPIEPNPGLRVSAVLSAASGLDGGADGGPDAGPSAPGATPGVRFAWEEPEVQSDQDWGVTYEGTLPGFIDGNGNPLVVAKVEVSDGGAPAYQTITLANKDAYFCGKGIEDFSLGQQRAQAENAALQSSGIAPIAGFDQQVADYIQLTDNLLDPSDPYWTLDNSCWNASEPSEAKAYRAATCSNIYGATLDPANPNTERDFPILEAHDDRLVIGRFGTTPSSADVRVVVGSDPSNVPFLRLMQCCFHNQVRFNVRTGGLWSAVGTSNGFLHHIVATGPDLRCQPSCETRDALLNGRAPPVPRPTANNATCSAPTPAIDRDSVLALRNPMFSFLIWNGQNPTSACADIPMTYKQRDLGWKFTTRGQFVPQSINLAASTAGLSPQSMRFIDSLGELAIVDGESQGLILISLDTIAEAHTPYF